MKRLIACLSGVGVGWWLARVAYAYGWVEGEDYAAAFHRRARLRRQNGGAS